MDPAVDVPPSLGEFRITGVLGQGGSGIVYDATWGPRRVALKVLHAEQVGPDARAQFLAEAARLQAVSHPHVVKVLASGELPDGRPYLAMERLAGESLAAVLARGPLALAPALALFGELCGAVGALHAQGLIHRDLKPENVFVVDGRHAVLLDFGIAKQLAAPASTTTRDGGVRGTPAYMAPERMFGQPASIATDLYELAVTLYAMLAGALPWDDVADPEARLAPRGLADVPPALDVEVRRALSTRAQNRPLSAAAFADAVRQAAGEPLADATAPSATARMARAPAAPAAPGRPWFAGRPPTTDRGTTPLAWAPTEAVAPSPARPVSARARRRWGLLAALGLVAVLGIGGIAWRLAATSARAPGPGPHEVRRATRDAGPVGDADPWNLAYERPPLVLPPPLPVSTPVRQRAALRGELTAAIGHVPPDTQILFGALVDELRAHEQLAALLGKLGREPRVLDLLGLVPCLHPLFGGASWVLLAAPSLDAANHGTLIVGGRWTRADVERCFAEAPRDTSAGATLLRLPHVGWVDFIDDHTVYVSVRDDLDAAAVHALARRGRGPTARTRALLGELPAERAAFVVADGSGDFVWPDHMLPEHADLRGWLRVARSDLALDVAVDAKSELQAEVLVARTRPLFDQVFRNAASPAIGAVTIDRDRAVFRIRGTFTSLMIGLLAAAIP